MILQELNALKSTDSMEKSSTATHVDDEFAGLLNRTKTATGVQEVFNEVLDQITAQEDDLGVKTSLYTLPSMNFLESLFDEMDSRNASNGIVSEPPLYLDIDELELPGLEQIGHVNTLEELGLHSPSMLLQKPAHSCPAAAMNHAHSGYSTMPFGSMGNLGMGMPNISAIRGMIPMSAANHNPFAVAPTAGSAAPSPVKRNFGKRIEDDDEDALNGLEYSYETSKSGRCRKVSSFVSGNKRKAHEMGSMYSAPATMEGRQSAGAPVNPYGREASEVASAHGTKKGTKCRNKSKTTVCLNCGSMVGIDFDRRRRSHAQTLNAQRSTLNVQRSLNNQCSLALRPSLVLQDTPQWRVGPLGPRTLCNACGVRYKKGLPLSCYPLRNGMVLPPGAVLPPSVIVPPGMNIVLQPLGPANPPPTETNVAGDATMASGAGVTSEVEATDVAVVQVVAAEAVAALAAAASP